MKSHVILEILAEGGSVSFSRVHLEEREFYTLTNNEYYEMTDEPDISVHFDSPLYHTFEDLWEYARTRYPILLNLSPDNIDDSINEFLWQEVQAESKKQGKEFEHALMNWKKALNR